MTKRTSEVLKDMELPPFQADTPLIIEQDLINLGFYREDDLGDGKLNEPFHYYCYCTIDDFTLLISNASDEWEKEGVCVEFYDLPDLGKFTYAIQINHLITLIKTMKK